MWQSPLTSNRLSLFIGLILDNLLSDTHTLLADYYYPILSLFRQAFTILLPSSFTYVIIAGL
jgi:hypothetical protein